MSNPYLGRYITPDAPAIPILELLYVNDQTGHVCRATTPWRPRMKGMSKIDAFKYAERMIEAERERNEIAKRSGLSDIKRHG